MDLSAIFQTRAKKFWWMDVIFYFTMSLLIAAILCYLIFLTKNGMQQEDIKKGEVALQTVGTDQQKAYEADVINYKNKIADFTKLLKNHEFASNVFAFMQAQTMPNVWFKQFGLDEKGSSVQLSGEADSMDALSRQVAIFEKNKYVKSIGTLSSSLGRSAKIEFNVSLALNQNIFGYLSDVASITKSSALSQPLSSQQGQITPATIAGQTAPTNNTDIIPLANGQQASQSQTATASSEKLITSFHLLLNPDVQGVLDETNYTVTLKVPYGTDIKNIASSIVTSPGASVLPPSGAVQDFTSPVTYRVTAQDGSIQNYTVAVNILPAPVKTSGQSGSASLLLIVSVFIIIVVVAAIILFVWAKSRKATL